MPADPARLPRNPEAEVIQLDFAADPFTVRTALEDVVGALAQSGFGPDDRALAEILLAEVLNNVVEHAYGGAGGWIELEARLATGPDAAAEPMLWVTVHDWGARMPEGVVPAGDLPPVAAADLPEGGFGWHLIRALAAHLDHGRDGPRNWLRFALAVEQNAR